jgi:hypothetical protein
MTQQLGAPQNCMFGHAARHSFAPHPERRWLHMAAHEVDYPGLVQAELRFNGFKGSAVFPSHLDDAGDVGFRKFLPSNLSGGYHEAANVCPAVGSSCN